MDINFLAKNMINLFNNSDNSTELFTNWSFSKKNYILFLFGLLAIIIGYIVMATGETNSFQSLTLAPIILFVGYIILIPASLIYNEKFFDKRKGS